MHTCISAKHKSLSSELQLQQFLPLSACAPTFKSRKLWSHRAGAELASQCELRTHAAKCSLGGTPENSDSFLTEQPTVLTQRLFKLLA